MEHDRQTRALLLTDVVDSTKLSEALGDLRMAEVWAAHDRVARDLLRPHRGREIDKTDGFLLLFESAADAVAYAVDYHRAIGALDPPLQARAGLHVGPVILTANLAADVALGAKPLEVDGLAKPTAARVMSVARGGQTLLTAEARAALGATDLRAESHGHWRMKGVAEPLELFEVGGPGAPFTPPPDGAKVYRVVRSEGRWLPVRQVRHSLPAERDTFVGREADLQDLARRLEDGARLVSVLGIGGTGKTRFVTRYGWSWLGDWPGGVWFCDLSEARAVDGIVAAVARAMEVPLDQSDQVEQLGHAIAGRGRCLVVLDNFEQVARHAAETVGRWLDRAGEAQFVVTTREVLGLPGEGTLALTPLREAEGLELFVARAVQARQDFTLGVADRPDVEELVRLLDGLPLAIELAAARVRLMAPAILRQRMAERFKLLSSVGGRHTRQATLRATLDWSWELLAPDEQGGLAQLSVFEGGFTLEAAEAVLQLREAWPTDAVQALVDKSLVRRTSHERFDLLVSVQDYASERLTALGARGAAEARHGEHFAARHGAAQALAELDLHGGVARRAALARELDNLVAACRRAVSRSDGRVAAATARATWAVVELSGAVGTGEALATEVLGVPTLTGAERASVTLVLAQALSHRGRPEARAHYEDALAAARALGDRHLAALCLRHLANLHRRQGRLDEARGDYEVALAEARSLGDRQLEGALLGNFGVLRYEHGGDDRGREYLDTALAMARASGDRRSEGTALANLALLLREEGRPGEARAHDEAALAAFREVGDRRVEAIVLGNLGLACRDAGRPDEARAHYDAALAVHRDVGNRRAEAVVLGNLGTLDAAEGRPREARAHLEAALALHREVGNSRFEGLVLGNLGNLAMDEGRHDDARAYLDAAVGVHRELGNRRFEGTVLGTLGNLHAVQGRTDEARAAFEAGGALLRAAGDLGGLCLLLCNRAQLEHADGRSALAQEVLAEAEALGARVADDVDGRIGRQLEGVRSLLTQKPRSDPSGPRTTGWR